MTWTKIMECTKADIQAKWQYYVKDKDQTRLRDYPDSVERFNNTS